MTGPLTAQSDDPLTLALDERWLDPGRARGVGFRLAIAAALAGHLFLGALLMGGFDGLLGAILGPGRGAQRPIGDKAGEIDGVAAEVIDAAEFNKRYISFKAGRAEAESEAQPQKPAERAEPKPEVQPEAQLPEEKPQGEQAATEKPADGWMPVEPKPTPVEQAQREARAHEKKTPDEMPKKEKPREDERPREPQPAQRPMFSEAEMQQIVTQSVEDLQSALVSVSTPGAARLGEASPFVRGVIRTLKNQMPRPPGMKGKVVVQLLIGATGEIEAIRVVRPSGRPDLDRFVVERVAKTKLAAPPATASMRERLFQISYEYN
jgi:TonB family protein